MREAAALPLVGITAFEGLTRAGIAEGQRVLVHGGSGGVGHVAVPLARHFGADVYATGGGDKHTEGAGFDVVFDSVGGANMAKSFEAAALNGQVATTAAMVELDLTVAHIEGLSLHVMFMLIPMIHNQGREEHARILNKLTEIVEAGNLRPVLDGNHFSLTEIERAHARLSSGEAMGKAFVEI